MTHAVDSATRDGNRPRSGLWQRPTVVSMAHIVGDFATVAGGDRHFFNRPLDDSLLATVVRTPRLSQVAREIGAKKQRRIGSYEHQHSP